MTTTATPWGLSRMKPFPATTAMPCTGIVLDPRTQTARWLTEDGSEIPAMDKHRASETSQETNTSTSLDGNRDEGHDQSGDSD
ncbi:putative ATP-grasp-modified RiPP [Streptomyces yunnanensis]|uniref:ATP-grasp-modified RiPP n=1 Tax=Streptomyces yunnanensis TaxID=156453 RepID=A0ABY8A984_9ACTN|nr:putative ATP-grasp-modified RiPP [Streptomyces yunnanensis]WEB40754.1 putative ATP-grasp-modified RiPP [Streptomyces yunnanensis]